MKLAVCQQNKDELHAAAKRKGVVLHHCSVTVESGQLRMVVGYDNAMMELRRSWTDIERGIDRQRAQEQLIDDLFGDVRAVMTISQYDRHLMNRKPR